MAQNQSKIHPPKSTQLPKTNFPQNFSNIKKPTFGGPKFNNSFRTQNRGGGGK